MLHNVSLRLIIKGLLRRKVITSLLFLQLALTLGLLANSSMLAQQAYQWLTQDFGVPLDEVITVHVLPMTPSLRHQPLLGDLITRQSSALSALPGVIAVSFANQPLLMAGGTNQNVEDVANQGVSNVDTVPFMQADRRLVETLGLTLVQGAWPAMATDDQDEPVILTQSLATRLFGNKDPIGQQTNRGVVAAVVQDFYGQRYATSDRYSLIKFGPMYSTEWGYSLLIRVSSEQQAAVKASVAEVLRSVDINTDVRDIHTLAEKRDLLFANERGFAVMLAVLSILMLLVTMGSSFSSAHFYALNMQHEIGIKRALGASRSQVLLDVLADNWLTTSVGAALGVITAYGLNHALSQAIQIPALPWWLLLGILSLLMLCVTLATLAPARAATRVSPALATKALTS